MVQTKMQILCEQHKQLKLENDFLKLEQKILKDRIASMDRQIMFAKNNAR